MSAIFQFGEKIEGSDIPVVNEREVRAAAGIFFFFAMLAFTKAFYMGDFGMTRILSVAFFIDFFIRVIINPRFSPSLIIGRWLVSGQTPEYVGAPQKRFAWTLGLLLSGAMALMVIVWDVRGPANMLVCVTCLTLLFAESALGICIGCKLYNLVPGNRATMCPGGVCEVHIRQPIQFITRAQVGALAAFVIGFGVLASIIPPARYTGASAGLAQAGNDPDRCKPPAIAVMLGHEENWKLHNNCK